METPQISATPMPLLPPGVERAADTVNLNGLDGVLWTFFTPLGRTCLSLFDTPVFITSARDGNHVQNSKHLQGKAVDFRTKNLPPKWEPVFLLVLGVLSDRFKLAVFDESNLPGEPHIHVEVAG